jgi:hypothetical protein
MRTVSSSNAADAAEGVRVEKDAPVSVASATAAVKNRAVVIFK